MNNVKQCISTRTHVEGYDPAAYWQDIISRCSFNFLVPKVTIKYVHDNGPAVAVTREVRERITGELKEITVVYPLEPLYGRMDAYAVWRICAYVEGNMLHEVQEHFTFDGKQVYFPQH